MTAEARAAAKSQCSKGYPHLPSTPYVSDREDEAPVEHAQSRWVEHGVVGQLADHAGAVEHLRERGGEALVGRGRDEPGSGRDHLLGVGGAADAGDPARPEARPQHDRGRAG